MDNIKTWTGLPVEESIRMTGTGINGESASMVWPTLGSRTAKEQNRTISGRAKARDFKFYIRVDHVKYQHTCDKVLEGNTLMFGDTRISLSVE